MTGPEDIRPAAEEEPATLAEDEPLADLPAAEPSTADAPTPDPLPVAASPAAPSPPDTRRSPRMRTVAFGFILGLVACSVLAARFSHAHLDGGTLLVIALVGAGILMVIGALTAPVRHRRNG